VNQRPQSLQSLPAYVTVAVTRCLPKNLSLVESKSVKTAVYMGVAVAAGIIWVVFLGVMMMPFILLQMK
jgi:hypothetical protein